MMSALHPVIPSPFSIAFGSGDGSPTDPKPKARTPGVDKPTFI